MGKKTAVTELRNSIKNRIPAAGTDEKLRALQSELGRIVYEIQKETITEERQQLRDAFNKGVVYGMLLASTKHDQSDTLRYNGFDQYFKDKYGDEA